MKNIKELKQTLKENPNKQNLLFQWVKNDKITYKQFIEILEYIKFLKEEAIRLDSI